MANISTDTKVCICAHSVISNSVFVCGSAASKRGQQRTGRSDSGIDIQHDPALANIDGEVAEGRGLLSGASMQENVFERSRVGTKDRT